MVSRSCIDVCFGNACVARIERGLEIMPILHFLFNSCPRLLELYDTCSVELVNVIVIVMLLAYGLFS